jgi:hypothetical protein
MIVNSTRVMTDWYIHPPADLLGQFSPICLSSVKPCLASLAPPEMDGERGATFFFLSFHPIQLPLGNFWSGDDLHLYAGTSALQDFHHYLVWV